ncbi:MAG: hypothetical protein AB7E70_03535 [Hyphomicrobiaceae bacterium]
MLITLPKRLISILVASAVATAQIGPTAPSAWAAGGEPADYAACQAQDEAGFRRAITEVTLAALTKGLSSLDYKALVRDQWRSTNMDLVIDKQVDTSIEQVRGEASWLSLWSSLASKDAAQKLAVAVSERVFRSDAVKNALEAQVVGAGKDIGKSIELATIDASGPAIACVRAFLGKRYGPTVAGVVGADASREFEIKPGSVTPSIGTGRVITEGAGGIAGAVVLIVRRQLAGMAQRLGQRIVGAVLGRIVATVAGGVGLILIAKDIWDFRHGVMPIISDELKSETTKEKVRDEIAVAMAEQIRTNVKEIAIATAERVVEVWREFRRAHAKVVELTEKHASFKAFLDTIRPERMPRLDEIVALVLASEGEKGVLERVANGSLHRAVNALPEPAIVIARDTRSLSLALAWSELAGTLLAKVVENDVHRRAKPEDFTRSGLMRVLALDDKLAISRLVSMRPADRQPLYELETPRLRTLARGLNEQQLSSLAGYLSKLKPANAQRVLAAVGMDPAKMLILSRPLVRDAILASRDQAAALDVVLRVSSGLDIVELNENFRLVLDGKVSPILLWEKHPVSLVIVAVLALAFLMFLWRLVFGRRTRIIVQAPNKD